MGGNRRGESVTLRGKRTDSSGAKQVVSFRCPADLWRYVEEAAQATGRDKTEIIIDAIALDRDLAVKLRAHAAQLEAVADEGEMSLDRDLAEVLARLVRAGLLARVGSDEKKNKR